MGRYYLEKKFYVRFLNFGLEVGIIEIRKFGYGRGYKKKIYDYIFSSVKLGGFIKK